MEAENKTSSHYASWSILELMGRTVVAGFVEEVTIGGAGMLRVDVPAIGDIPAWSKFYGATAIFACTPVGEEEAMMVARKLKERPISTYILPAAKPLTMRLLDATENAVENDYRYGIDDDDHDDNEGF